MPELTFIVPAHNEQACLGRTLEAIHASARAVGRSYEVLVVDDASTDTTAEVAQRNGARVVSVNHRQIAATRNAGGRQARGDRLFFVDADTTINPRAVRAALQHLDQGAAGGGAAALLDDGAVPMYTKLLSALAVPVSQLAGFTGGAFMFCTRTAFQATGGFNERLYWAEEGGFALALKREGRFVVLSTGVKTSGRRFRRISGLKVLLGGIRLLLSPVRSFTQRSFGQQVWYDSDRADDDRAPSSLTSRLSNGIALIILTLALTSPIWGLVPWTLTPLASPLGKVRLGITTCFCHAGLVLWPLGLILLVNLLRQKRWTGVLHSTALITFVWWQAWGATHGVLWVWARCGNWLGRLFQG